MEYMEELRKENVAGYKVEECKLGSTTLVYINYSRYYGSFEEAKKFVLYIEGLGPNPREVKTYSQ